MGLVITKTAEIKAMGTKAGNGLYRIVAKPKKKMHTAARAQNIF